VLTDRKPAWTRRLEDLCEQLLLLLSVESSTSLAGSPGDWIKGDRLRGHGPPKPTAAKSPDSIPTQPQIRCLIFSQKLPAPSLSFPACKVGLAPVHLLAPR
jgi:hypothetical protein